MATVSEQILDVTAEDACLAIGTSLSIHVTVRMRALALLDIAVANPDGTRLMNALKNETSPYLLQHADNPVNWYPWRPASLDLARSMNKPILLSIGYSACHWCHVMAHESFEDPATAALMNELFINIKVDREERPDIDKIYQNAQYLLTQRPGGWPLTMFLTPDDHIPFLGGTYFPPEARHGLPAFADLLQRIASTYRDREAEIRAQNVQVMTALSESQTLTAIEPSVIDDTPLRLAREQAERAFDKRLGGFGRAPKFPHPSALERLFHDYYRSDRQDDHALHMALFTLTRMARGGIFDHLGGAFFRYSVDNQWMIPHFEKMLYDNGPLISTYSHAWRVDQDPTFAHIVHETVTWLRREMTSPDGGFYSSLDADSEGEEGKFYAWDSNEVHALLGDDHEPFGLRYGLAKDANFESKWHLRIVSEYHEIANVLGGEAKTLADRVERAKSVLFEQRETRVRPARDNKILTAWNALTIKGLAVAGNVFKRPDYIDDADQAVAFIRDRLWQEDRLLAAPADHNLPLNAYLDDYAFLIDALLNLLSARWHADHLDFAIMLTECLLQNFEDKETGGFFFTSHDHETLIQRTKPLTDDALPAGNGVAAHSIGRLGHLLGETHYIEASKRTLLASWRAIESAPGAHNALLLALEDYLEPPTSIILRGDIDTINDWKSSLEDAGDPRLMCFAIPTTSEELPGLLGKHAATDRPVAYVCHGHQCHPPVYDLEEIKETLT